MAATTVAGTVIYTKLDVCMVHERSATVILYNNVDNNIIIISQEKCQQNSCLNDNS